MSGATGFSSYQHPVALLMIILKLGGGKKQQEDSWMNYSHNETVQHQTQRKEDRNTHSHLPSSLVVASSTLFFKEVKPKSGVALPPLLSAHTASWDWLLKVFVLLALWHSCLSCCPSAAWCGCEQLTLQSGDGCRRCCSLMQQGPHEGTSAAFVVQRPAPCQSGIFLCGTKWGSSIVLGCLCLTEAVNSLHIFTPKGLLFYLSNILQGGAWLSWTLDSCKAPVLQILWERQMARRGRDRLGPDGSRRPCIQRMTWSASIDVICVVTCGERSAAQTSALLSTEEQTVQSSTGNWSRSACFPAAFQLLSPWVSYWFMQIIQL